MQQVIPSTLRPAIPSVSQPVITPLRGKGSNPERRVHFEDDRPNIADRKRLKKQEVRSRRDLQFHALQYHQQIMQAARIGYELFHELPVGSCTDEQVVHSSSGVRGYAAYGDRVERAADG